MYKDAGQPSYTAKKGYYPKKTGYNKSLNAKVNYLIKKDNFQKKVNQANRNFATYGKNAQTMSQTTVTQRLTAIATGTGLGTRVDLNITLSSMYYKYIITGADATNVCRVLFLQAKGHWAVGSPVDADIFRQASSGGNLGYEMPVNTEAWHILVDETVGITTASDAVKVIEGTVYKFKEKTLKYSDTTSQSCTSGDIWIVTCSDSGAVSHPTISGFAKIKYYE